jgi:hypothetical protein
VEGLVIPSFGQETGIAICPQERGSWEAARVRVVAPPGAFNFIRVHESAPQGNDRWLVRVANNAVPIPPIPFVTDGFDGSVIMGVFAICASVD